MKYLKIILFIIFVFSIKLNGYEKENGKITTIVFAGQTNYPPFEYVDQNGNYEGITVELIRWIATEMGFKAEFKNDSFQKIQNMAKNRSVDVITSFFKSDERKREFVFTDILFKVPSTIFIDSKRTDIKNLKDLNGKIVSMQKGDYAEEYLNKQNISSKIIYTEDFYSAILSVLKGDADCVIGDEQIVYYSIFKYNLDKKIKTIGVPLYIGKDCMSALIINKEIIDVLDEGLKRAKEAGVIDKLEIKWFGKYFRLDEDIFTKYFYLLISLAAGLLVIVIILYFINRKKTILLEDEHGRRLLSEAKYKTFFKALPDLIFVVDKTYTFIDFHAPDSGTKLLIKKDKIIGTNILKTDLFDNIFKIKSKTLIDEALKSKKIQIHEYSFNTSGSLSYFSSRIIPFADDSVLIVIQDVTEKQSAVLNLEKERYKLSITLRSINEGVIATDEYFKITVFNKEARKITELKKENVLGKGISEIEEKLKISYKMTFDAKTIFKNSNIKFRERVEIFTLKGHKKIVERMVSPIVNNKNEIAGIIIVLTDVTEREKFEREQSKIRKIESIGTLAAGLAHNFNNILTSVIGNLSLVKSRLKVDSRLYKILGDSEKSAFKAAALTKKLLTFSKGGDPIKENSDISGVITKAIKTVFDESNTEIRVLNKDDIINAFIDEEQIRTSIVNILYNAKDAMVEKGILDVKLEQFKMPEFNEFMLKKGGYIKINIRDNGCGIENSVIQKIFDPYFSTKEDRQGLGLSVAYSIIRKHGGIIEATSDENMGTLITIYLPSGLNDELIELKNDTKNTKILIMDDDKMIRELLNNSLVEFNYSVDMASTGEEVIEFYDKSVEQGNPYNLLILDLIVDNGMGGRETMEILLKKYDNVNAIVSSGYSNNDIMTNYRKYGFQYFMTKPYNIEKLLEVVKQFI